MQTVRSLGTDDVRRLLDLLDGADTVELKLTVPASGHRSAIRALEMDPLDAQVRQVYFFDTPGLDLHHAGVVARARCLQGKGGDSVVKLRPVVPDALPEEVRASPSTKTALEFFASELRR